LKSPVTLTLAWTLCLVFCGLAMQGCQTSSARYRSFSNIHPGMSKTSVLETAGGPDHALRANGKLRWIYVFYNDRENPDQHEVQFENGKVSYIGPVTQPEVTAEEQDRRNEFSNDADESKTKQENEVYSKRVGRMHVKAGGRNSDFEDSMYGGNPEVERNKVAPTFVPVK
jgi:outer membrane protein assembly factor BamE (lipoprotein component of BamABCDE complex)